MNDRRFCGRNLVAFHETLGKNLARFESAARAIGAECRDAGRSQAIADARGNGGLGSENSQIDAFAQRSFRQRLTVGGADIPVLTARRRPGVSRRSKNCFA